MRVAVDLNRKRVMIVQASEKGVIQLGKPSWFALQKLTKKEKMNRYK